MLDCFAKTLKHDGLGAFYNGFLPNWVRCCSYKTTKACVLSGLRNCCCCLQGRLGVYNVALFLTLEQVGNISLCMLHKP